MYTIKDIIELDPCEEYTKERLKELWKGKKALSRRDILELDIPIDDRNWVIPQLVSTKVVTKWAQYCANEAEKHADANVNNARYAARYAAWSAAWSVADTAAGSAVYAADAAAWSAAGYAAWSVARCAANYADDRAENKEKELYRLLTILCDMEEESK